MEITKLFYWTNCANCSNVESSLRELNARNAFEDFRVFEFGAQPNEFNLYNVNEVPTVLVFRNGVEAERYTGVDQTNNFIASKGNLASGLSFTQAEADVPFVGPVDTGGGNVFASTSDPVLNTNSTTDTTVMTTSTESNPLGSLGQVSAIAPIGLGLGAFWFFFLRDRDKKNRR